MPLRSLWARLRSLVRRDAIVDEIREELQFHVDSRVAQYEQEGLMPEEARRRARRRVGNVAVHLDRGYDIRGGGVMETVLQDVRYSLRLLRRERAFATVALLTLALGIGASTSIFSVIDAALLRPLPYPHPEQLVDVLVDVPGPDGDRMRLSPSLADVRTWLADSRILSDVAISRDAFFKPIVDGPVPERLAIRHVTEAYLRLYGVAPIIGRGFNVDDTLPGAPAVALVGHSYWQTRFGGSDDVLGKTLRFEDGPAIIVGVLPSGFQRTTAIWRPFREQANRGSGADVVARLAPGTSMAQARAALNQHAGQVRGTLPEMENVKVELRSILAGVVGSYTETTTILAGAVGLILLIACVNVAGLLLARGSSRHAEFATRASIGAGRSRLVRQLLTESLLLALAGGALGVGLAWLSLDVIVANIPLELPADAPPTINVTVLLFSAGLATLTGLLFGLFPALRLSRLSPVSSLKGHRQSGVSLTARGGRLLIALEIAVAVVLLLGATLMIRSFAKILSVDLGFEPSSFVTMNVAPLDANLQASYYPALVDRLTQMPVVEAAGAIDMPPLGEGGIFGGVSVDGRDYDVDLRSVLPGYFQAMGQLLRRGRFLEARDVPPGQRVVVVSEQGARTFFEGRDPIGGRLVLGEGAPYEVVGVVSDIKPFGPTSRLDNPTVYLPYRPSGHDTLGLTIVVRPRGSSTTLAADLKRVAESIGPRVLVERVRSGEEWLADDVVRPRRRTVLLALLGGLGLVLALVGVFGVTAYAVARRTHEIGVRVACGARPAQVVVGIAREAARPIGIGVVAGLAAGLFATRALANFLFQIQPHDRTTFAVVGVVLAATAALAAWLPARRAAHVDPVTALRAE